MGFRHTKGITAQETSPIHEEKTECTNNVIVDEHEKKENDKKEVEVKKLPDNDNIDNETETVKEETKTKEEEEKVTAVPKKKITSNKKSKS